MPRCARSERCCQPSLEGGIGPHPACLRFLSLFLLSILILGGSAIRLHATDIFVSLDGNHVWPYSAWDDAATNVQAALLASVDGDAVIVTDGVFVVSSQIEITNSVVVRSVNGPLKTSIRGAYPATSNRCFRITHPNAFIQSFTISNGWAEDGQRGGGVLCDPGGTVQDCILVHNRAADGGGIACVGGGFVLNCLVASNTATLRGGGVVLEGGGEVDDCQIEENTAKHGGGVYCSGNGAVRNTRIASNYASVGPGGALCEYGGLLLDSTVIGNVSGDAGGGVGCSEGGVAWQCLITRNNAFYAGGGCVLDGLIESGAAVNCSISSNRAQIGGGVALGDLGALQHCTVVTNHATGTGGGVYFSPGGSVSNTIVYYNTASNAPNWFNDGADSNFITSCTFPMPPGWGNITNDPQFANAALEDYHLAAGSPCIDAGTNIAAVTNDFDGIPRPLDGDNDGMPGWDIGAYEFVHSSVDTDNDTMPDRWEIDNELDALIDDQTGDPDFDGMNNGGEYVADTDPHDGESVLSVIGIDEQAGGIRLDWKGGQDAWQFLECRSDLVSTTDQWTAIFAVPPPTPLTNAIIDLGATNRTLFYRIRAER